MGHMSTMVRDKLKWPGRSTGRSYLCALPSRGEADDECDHICVWEKLLLGRASLETKPLSGGYWPSDKQAVAVRRRKDDSFQRY